jgi:hypothetical protein
MGSASVADPQQEGWRRWLSGWRRDARGAVYVEFLIAFLPVYTMFLCLIQLGLLFTVRLIVDHAALNAARAAAVVIGDDEGVYDYGGQDTKHTVTPPDGKRHKVVEAAALLTLAPLIVNGVVQAVDVEYPPPNEPGGTPQSGTIRFTPMHGSTVQKVRVRVTVEALCRIGLANRIVCRLHNEYNTVKDPFGVVLPYQSVRSEAIFPYQGAAYDP